MKLKTGDRLLISGKTGSGKTWLANRLTATIPRLIVLDPKATLADWQLREPRGLDWTRFRRGGAGRFRILPPVVDDPESWYEQLFENVYNLGNVTLYIDEAYAVVAPGARPGKWLNALYTRGRERGIGVWTATQRPAWIPVFMLSEADMFITFRLNVAADRQRIASIVGDEVLGRVPDVHGFWVYRVEEDEPLYYRTAVPK